MLLALPAQLLLVSLGICFRYAPDASAAAGAARFDLLQLLRWRAEPPINGPQLDQGRLHPRPGLPRLSGWFTAAPLGPILGAAFDSARAGLAWEIVAVVMLPLLLQQLALVLL